MRADCTGKRLFDTQIALRFGSKMQWVEICCARFLDAAGAFGAKTLGARTLEAMGVAIGVVGAMGVLDAMVAGSGF
jgi:hypothetical protein